MYKFNVSNTQCAPSVDKEGKFKTCYSKESLLKMASELKKKNKRNIVLKKKSKKELWGFIQNEFGNICSKKEDCWKNQPEIKKLNDININKYTFKPEYPSEWKNDKHTWLNTYDILRVMKQYEKKHDDFKFLGVVPSDCPTKITCELSNIDLKRLKKNNIHKIGLVYNLDVSSGPGTHWVAIYIDNKNNEINYYDSYGSKPIKLINEFIHNLKKKYEKINEKPILIYNNKRHQYGGSECGMYSINFLLERLNNVNMYEIYNRNISDKKMNDLRKLIYKN
tara:strand:- start:23 stop:859 length:837 start_codon:yes stop_codon:yes gene_type:complete